MELTFTPKGLPPINAFSKATLALGAVWFSMCIASAQIGTTTRNGPRIGEVPPPLALGRMVQGPPVETVTWDKVKGKVVVLEFWGTECMPCIEAIPHMNELIEQFSSRPVVFLDISNDNEDYLKDFLKRRPMKGWLALDGSLNPTATAFDVAGIPRTVIVAMTGRIAAITNPALLTAQHLEEILAGKPSTLPAPETLSSDAAPVIAVSRSLPGMIEISIRGPFPQPDGPYGRCRWTASNCVYQAEKAPALHALAVFFRLSPKLIFAEGKLPEGLYDILMAGPPDQMEQVTEVNRQFIEAVKTKWGVQIQISERDVSIYSMTVCATKAPGLKAAQERRGGGERPGGFLLAGVPMKSIASSLEEQLDKSIIDETGLTGLWSADLKWEMSESELSSHSEPEPAKVIKAAREQLGLDLQPSHRTMTILEIRTSNH
jgi:uncharacterized protein (TIGR03435 family)